ncbi:hypothetical protein [Streptomyces acidiscabies]|uniref:Uncharacterized protein n=1 Tax=Streptomyces acidiscabies TaxID=42234 RepID=A0AAP6BLS1_9ACTN|nr:hypothetical protein [Streptomyces acidiscabies]MBP5936735.1 hypothetical protein [Streptomyces sp. LBUM 1476]MBZ3915259.1 hypothetical protein [Streptomyces acidiscabies]MDX2967020.1 hypothetical protein [Streptomyces acidiscabies]MDX3021321.1 hypothetical protein [Streptomyces acidiscabies]MDX3793426.1 hypothetical protein [Streptomyces acidiscabies]
MRSTPATAAEVDAWLTVLHTHGHLHHRETHPDGTWSVREHPDSIPWTLHHPVLAMDWIEALVREIAANEPDTRR